MTTARRANDRQKCRVDQPRQHFAVRLARTPQAPRTARRAVDGFADMLDAALLDDLRLVVTELVTNSLEHVTDDASPIGLLLQVADTVVHVEVRDAGPGFSPSKPQPSLYATRGRGLAIVDELADRWGVTSGPPHKVWCHIDHQHGTRPADAGAR